MKIPKKKLLKALEGRLLGNDAVSAVLYDPSSWPGPKEAQVLSKYLKRSIKDIETCVIANKKFEFLSLIGIHHLKENRYIMLDMNPGRCIRCEVEISNGKWTVIQHDTQKSMWPDIE